MRTVNIHQLRWELKILDRVSKTIAELSLLSQLGVAPVTLKLFVNLLRESWKSRRNPDSKKCSASSKAACYEL